MQKKLLEVKGLRTYFHTFKGIVKAVDNVSFDIHEGEILGVVGESGGGKSITGFSVIGLIDEPGKIESGEILFQDQDLMKLSESQMNLIRGKEISMVFQDPMTSLNPVYTIGEQLEEMLLLHENLSKQQRRERCIQLLKDVGISNPESRLKNYPHQFSGGMRQRVVIAIALAAKPKLIIADEPTTALDVTIQAQILKLMKQLVKEQGCALMLITHDLAVVSEMADRVNVMYCGKIVESGYTEDIIQEHIHPYTEGLLDSIPDIDQEKERLKTIPGIVPNMFDLPKGCNFSPRCQYCQDICLEKEPELVHVGERHFVSCHFPLRKEAR
ncbi:ABC transporter ATP-binding protein [Geosporobacter ferrireducens]|uniref:Dipeptide/oligopeptide/nickel ABC transporter ATP-binding protein n=1 Tax=Geosporobacter ferrireducens TaxID=1424294 RepID=A0A1D8GNP2_9FIRM|nr:ABC transporter ATP-binding protein [Geosporobacter ferrireducens]AOT72561.1 dipeptide/oligopeptide/nickel ABC transporter ATP-binding protein [Geosporobacter ferrireducens]MTI54955.1 ABC transporter ATP-binding protein [Geosporobacter ferrireducens]